MFEALIIGAVLAGVSPLIAFASEKLVNKGRRVRAFKRITNDRLYQVGTTLNCIKQDGTGENLVGRCEIVDISVGRMELRLLDPARSGQRFSLTGAEFEKLTPIAEFE